MPRLSSEYYVEIAHPRCVDVLAIRKTAETDVFLVSTATEEIHYHEVLLGSLAETVPILVQYRVSFSTAAIVVSPLAGVRG
jgi:hypothetical protein